ncbi:unnamed protein product [Calypogeia fissa]
MVSVRASFCEARIATQHGERYFVLERRIKTEWWEGSRAWVFSAGQQLGASRMLLGLDPMSKNDVNSGCSTSDSAHCGMLGYSLHVATFPEAGGRGLA